MTKPAPPPPEMKVPIRKLPKLLPELLARLAQPDRDESAARMLLHGRLRVSCPDCGQAVTVEELASLAAAGAEKGPSDRVLMRLSQGRCAALGCDADHYQVSLEQKPGEDWLGALAAVAELAADQPGSSRFGRTAGERKALLLRLLVGAGVLGSVLLIKHRMDGGRIPLLDGKPKYQVSPGAAPLPH